MTKWITGLALVSLTLAVLLPAASRAGDDPQAASPRDRMLRAAALWNTSGDPREMLKIYRVWKITEALDLSDDQTTALVARLERIDEREAEVAENEREALDEIGRLLDKPDASDEELAKALSTYEVARTEGREEVRQMRQDLFSALTVRQRCNYVVFENRFQRDIRQVIGRARDLRVLRERGDVREGRRPRERGKHPLPPLKRGK